MTQLRKDDDLFNMSSMSFGEHLNELRRCLIHSITWLVGAFVIALIPLYPYPSLSTMTVDYIQKPLSSALSSFYISQSEEKLKVHTQELEKNGYSKDIAEIPQKYHYIPKKFYVFPEDMEKIQQISNLTIPESPASLADTQEKSPNAPVSKTSLDSAGNAAPNAASTAEEPIEPSESAGPAKSAKPAGPAETTGEAGTSGLAESTGSTNPAEPTESSAIAASATPSDSQKKEPSLVILWEKLSDDSRIRTKALSSQEPFTIFVKAAFFIAVVLAAPGICYNFWAFIGAGLYAHEKKYVYRILPVSLGLFFAGFLLAFFVVIKMVLEFLLRFNAGMNIDPDLRISEWLNFVLILPIGFGLAFQLPLVMFALERLRIFTVEAYMSSWKISVLVISVLSMMLTPPDPWSMVCMVVPLIGLYFGGIILCVCFPLPKNEFDD